MTDLWCLRGVELEALYSVCTQTLLDALSLVVAVIKVHHDRPVARSPRASEAVDDQTMQWTHFI